MKNIFKYSVEQGEAAWIDYLKNIRLSELFEKLKSQDVNLEKALEELQKIRDFIGDPSHILGSLKTKHGEIAEHIEVGFNNAENLVVGEEPTYTFDGVGRLDKTDYLKKFIKAVQSKFYHDYDNTFDAVMKHNETYDYLKQGGTYDIPNDQYKQIIDILRRGNNPELRSSLSNKEWSEYNKYIAWEKENGCQITEAIHPAKADYADVQLNKAGETIDQEEAKIKDTDKEIRDDAVNDSKPKIEEGVKVVGVAIATEALMAFLTKVYQKKKKEGKWITAYTEDDWKEVGIDTGKGALKGGIRGAGVFILTNYTPVPAPIATAMFTAAFGIAAEIYKYNQNQITLQELFDDAEIIVLDVAVSSLSSIIGQELIPIPILGSIIGNVVGMFVLGLFKDNLSQYEETEIQKYLDEEKNYAIQLDEEYKAFMEQITERINQFNSIIAYALDDDVNKSFYASIKIATLAGVSQDKILKTTEEIDSFFES